MVKFVVINKYGVLEDMNVKTMDNLYKKCKFRKKGDFENRHTWRLLMNDKKIYVHLFAKNTGRHVSINKYELPPPLDSDLFYGAMAVVASENKENTKNIDMTLALWKQIYEKLMGGFEDLDNDDNDEDKEEFIPVKYRTKQGYSKETDFVVDDGNIEYNSSSSSPEEDEYEFSDSSDNSKSDDEEEVPKDELVVSEGEAAKDEDEDEDEEDEEDEEEENPDSELSEEEYEQEN